ncbi:MAG: hypothetical protein WDA18_01375 [Candidatus Ratteibacteria bacterium]
MRTKITIVVWAFLIVGSHVLFFSPLACAAPTLVSSEVENAYSEGVKAYYQKDYAKALSLFSGIRGVAPDYRKFQISHYIRTSEGKLGKKGEVEVFKSAFIPSTQVEVSREDEMERISEEAQKVLLDSIRALNDLKREGQYSDFQLLPIESILKMARESYDDAKYLEAIRLSNKARFTITEFTNQLKPGMTVGPMGGTLVSLQLMDADLEQTLKLIYDLTGANIVMSKGISGRVTINVKDLPLQRVLDLICEMNSLKYFEDNGVIKIMTQEEFVTSPAMTKAKLRKVYPVRYNDASSIVRALKETFKLSTIVYEPRTNSILVDVPDETTSVQVAEAIASLDSPISEVMLEAKLVEVAINDSSSYGIDWLFASRLIENLGNATLTGPRFGTNPAFTPGVSSSLPDNTFAFGVTSNDVNVLLNAISVKGKVKLLQSPKIMCLNGTSASIRVYTNVPYLIPVSTVNQQQQTITTSSTFNVYEEVVGTEFEVTPIIQKNRNVFLSLNIIDSRLLELRTLKAIAAGSTYETTQPVITSRETSQSIVIFDGQTLVIGGMIQEQKSLSTTGVPFIQRIPLLGALFRKPSLANNKSEMLLFITPRIVSTFEDSVAVTRPDEQKANPVIDDAFLKQF